MSRDPGEFWRRVDMSGGQAACWPWTGAQDGRGYGSVFWPDAGRSTLGAHQVAYLLTHGSRPGRSAGQCIRHTCDNRLCCNPAHLVAGTIADNNRDKRERGGSTKGRNVNVGRRNPAAKLDEAAVVELRRLSELGWSQRRIASALGCSQSAVSRALAGATWSHLERGQ